MFASLLKSADSHSSTVDSLAQKHKLLIYIVFHKPASSAFSAKLSSTVKSAHSWLCAKVTSLFVAVVICLYSCILVAQLTQHDGNTFRCSCRPRPALPFLLLTAAAQAKITPPPSPSSFCFPPSISRITFVLPAVTPNTPFRYDYYLTLCHWSVVCFCPTQMKITFSS